MSNLWLSVDVQPGASISSACNEAIALAERMDITIWFSFNGVKCLARKGDDPRRLEADWNRAMSSKVIYKIASDKGEVPNGKWRMTATSDEDGGGPHPLCDCAAAYRHSGEGMP